MMNEREREKLGKVFGTALSPGMSSRVVGGGGGEGGSRTM